MSASVHAEGDDLHDVLYADATAPAFSWPGADVSSTAVVVDPHGAVGGPYFAAPEQAGGGGHGGQKTTVQNLENRPPPVATHDYASSGSLFAPPQTAKEWESLQIMRGYQGPPGV
ncbi:unnamed protein product [Amoebophrya sp. A120]|nr:unnamed protein product [Amoebophrya sp. A120]|eukprot:GSA120T00025301001.1